MQGQPIHPVICTEEYSAARTLVRRTAAGKRFAREAELRLTFEIRPSGLKSRCA